MPRPHTAPQALQPLSLGAAEPKPGPLLADGSQQTPNTPYMRTSAVFALQMGQLLDLVFVTRLYGNRACFEERRKGYGGSRLSAKKEGNALREISTLDFDFVQKIILVKDGSLHVGEVMNIRGMF